MNPVIRDIAEGDHASWCDLWEQYLVFYETSLGDDHSAALWQRLLDPSDPVECLVAEAGDAVVGIVHFLAHSDTWGDRPLCYLQDLFVHPDSRGRGAAAALIRAVSERAADRGWSAVYWQTAADNERARRLYDQLTGGPSGFIVYELDLPK